MNMTLGAFSDLAAVTGGPHHAVGEQWACLILGAETVFIQYSRPELQYNKTVGPFHSTI